MPPPRQAAPATPSRGGEWSDTILVQTRHATTPSGCACHPSRGGEWSDTILVQTRHHHPVRQAPATPPEEGNGPTLYWCRHAMQPPCQAAPATPPEEGNGPTLYWCRHDATTLSGCACHPSRGGEWSDTILVQTRCHHPVRLRLPPLQRRGMVRHYTGADTMPPPRQAAPATPPEEGNGPTLYWCRHDATTTLSGCACHPSRGGEMVRHYTSADTMPPPRQSAPATPPEEGNGPTLYWYRHAMPPPRQAAPATPPEEGNGPTLYWVQTRCHHPVRLRLPPLQRRGMVRHYTGADTMPPPCQAAPATPPEEGNGPTLYWYVRHAMPPLRQAAPATPPEEGNGPTLYWYRHDATTPSGCACHPSRGGEWSDTILVQTTLYADTPQPPVRLRLPPLQRRGMVRHYTGADTPCNHPVRLRLPPLQRRGMVRHYTGADTPQPPRQAAPATEEGNGPTLYWYRHATTTLSGCACHPSRGGEWSDTILVQTRCHHPVRLRLPTPPEEGNGPTLYWSRRYRTRCVSVLVIPPPEERNGPTLYWCRHATTTPSGCRLPPLQRRGIALASG